MNIAREEDQIVASTACQMDGHTEEIDILHIFAVKYFHDLQLCMI